MSDEECKDDNSAILQLLADKVAAQAHKEHIDKLKAFTESKLKAQEEGEDTVSLTGNLMLGPFSSSSIANTSFVQPSQQAIHSSYGSSYGPGSIVVNGHGEIAKHDFNGNIAINPHFIANQIIETSVPVVYGNRSHNFCIKLLELLKALPLEKKQKVALNLFADDTVTSYRNLDDEELINYLKLTL
jgi:hypothetical protein